MTGRRKVRLANGREASALDIQGEYLARVARLRRPARAAHPGHRAGARPVGAQPEGGRVRRPGRWSSARSTGSIKWKLIDALPRQARPAAGATRGSRSSTWPTTTSTASRGLYYLLEKRGAGRAGHHRPGDLRGQVGARRRPPGPGCAATSSGAPRSAAATSPSTGCTSSSTTRRSAPCCARTRSAPRTSASTASSTACPPRDTCPLTCTDTASHSRRCGTSQVPRLSWTAVRAAPGVPEPKVSTPCPVASPHCCPSLP